MKNINSYELNIDSLIAEYSGIVRDVANRMYVGLPFGSVDKEDLISEGIIALIKCFDVYDSSKKSTFSSYARVRIVGAMKDFLRRQDILPQKKRIEVKRFEKNLFDLEMVLGRKPSEKEILKYMDISQKKYSEIIQCKNMSSYVYIDSYEQSPLEKIEVVDNESNPFENTLSVLVHALESSELSDNHKIILQLYYYDELSFKHISEALNLSTARISQLHSQALKILRTNIHSISTVSNNNEISLS